MLGRPLDLKQLQKPDCLLRSLLISANRCKSSKSVPVSIPDFFLALAPVNRFRLRV
jgi:hypothetical protein